MQVSLFHNNIKIMKQVVAPTTTATSGSATKIAAPETRTIPDNKATTGHVAAIENKISPASSSESDSLSMSSTSSSLSSVAVEYAQRIWDQDSTVYDDLDHVVEWIGDGKPASNLVLESYMGHFDFKGVYLEQAFRNLCSKLSLKGETQQIDRILMQFSKRYFECNPRCILASPDVIHAIVYSLLLLNTDLHVAQGDYKKMSRSAFVKNTMTAIYAQLDITPADIEEEGQGVDHRTTSGLSFQSTIDWMPLQRTPSTQSAFSTRSSTYAQSLDSSLPRNISSSTTNNSNCAFGSKPWQMEIKNILKQMYSNIRHSHITDPSTPPSSNRVSAAFKRSIGTIIWKGARDSIISTEESNSISSSVQSANASSAMQYQSVASHLQLEIPTFYISNAPYYKEGMVVRKHLLERTNQKAKHRDWRDCFMVVESSQLRMYKLDTSTISSCSPKRHTLRNTLMPRSTSNFSDSASQLSASDTTVVVGGGDWMSNAQLMGSVDLKHTLANALPSGYSRQRQHAFALQQSNGAVFLFQVGSDEQVHEWTSTLNYMAARASKQPMVDGISSMEYGWGDCLLTDNKDAVVVNEWEAPLPAMTSSMLDETAQLKALCKHVQELSVELDQHRDIKPKMEARFQNNSKLGPRAMANWEAKSHFLLHEIIKYQNYCNSIEKSISLQAKINSTATASKPTN